MPRKTTTPLDAMSLDTPSNVSGEIVASLDNLPPGMFALLAKTPDQKRKYNQDRAFFRRVGAIIDSYFNGTAPPSFDAMPKYEREELWDEAWQYLAFYGLVWSNWESIEPALAEAAKPELPEIEVGGVTIQLAGADFDTLTEPSDVLIEAMRYRALSRMSGAFGQSEGMSANAMRTSLKDVRNARRSDASKLLKNRVNAEQTALFKKIPWAKLENTCVEAAIKAQKRGIKNAKIAEYLKACRAKEAHLAKKLHPRNGYLTGKWKNGMYEKN